MNRWIAEIGSLTLVKLPQRMAWRVMIEKKTTTMFSHEPEVGVKCSMIRRLRAHGSALFSDWYTQDGAVGYRDRAAPMIDPPGILTSRDITALVMAHWQAPLADVQLEGCNLRMMDGH
jgi:hypothetical protein